MSDVGVVACALGWRGVLVDSGEAVEPVKHSRWVLLNHLFSFSTTRSTEHKAPFHSADEMLQILRHRWQLGLAVEVFDSSSSDSEDEKVRIAGGKDHNFIRLRYLDLIKVGDKRYAVCLVDAVDHRQKSMPVLDVISYEGRDISGKETERGAFSAHVIIKLPAEGAYDDGHYRCAIEASPGIPRKNIERLFNRQLRRYARGNPFEFEVVKPRVRKPLRQTFVYQPKFRFTGDVSRSIVGKKRDVSHMVFTKRSEKQSITAKTQVLQDDVFADVDLRVSAKQGPVDPEARKTWVNNVIGWYEERGFKTKLYFRHLGGRSVGGALGLAEDGAADLMLCPKEAIETTTEPRRWVGVVQSEVRDEMIKLLDRDELWERTSAQG